MTFPYPPEPAATVANPFVKLADMQSAATKTTPVDADGVIIIDSAASNAIKRTLWSAVKATLKTYFDTLYFGTSFTKAQLDAAVSDDNVAYLGQSQTFIGNQTITGNITASGTGTFSTGGRSVLIDPNSGGFQAKIGTSSGQLEIASANSNLLLAGANVYVRPQAGGTVYVTDNVAVSLAGNITASGTATLGIYTVATLPAASTNAYAEANVSDALAPTMGSTVAAGGTVKTKVRSNGTNWTVCGI